MTLSGHFLKQVFFILISPVQNTYINMNYCKSKLKKDWQIRDHSVKRSQESNILLRETQRSHESNIYTIEGNTTK